jgi:hypothetical protein
MSEEIRQNDALPALFERALRQLLNKISVGPPVLPVLVVLDGLAV